MIGVAERQALLEQVETTLIQNAGWAASEGGYALEMVVRSVGTAMMSAAREMTQSDVDLTTFYDKYPTIATTLH